MPHLGTRICTAFLGMALACAAISPAAAHDTDQEAANKQVVLDFYDALNDADEAGAMQQHIAAIAEEYLHPGYTQHSDAFKSLPGPGSDREKLVRLFQNQPPMPGGPLPRATTVSVMAEGDRVMLLTRRDMADPANGTPKPVFMFNMFRVADGKLVEHWDTGGAGAPPPGAGGPPPGTGGPTGDLPPGAR